MSKFHVGMLVGMALGSAITIFVLGLISIYRAERRKGNGREKV